MTIFIYSYFFLILHNISYLIIVLYCLNMTKPYKCYAKFETDIELHVFILLLKNNQYFADPRLAINQ